MSGPRLVAAYLGAQALLVGAWWALLIVAPATRAWFEPPDRPEVLTAFWVPDAVLLAIGSAAASLGAARRAPWARAAAWIVLGGLAYATLYCLGLVLHAGGPWLPVITMAPACVATAVCARTL